MSQFDALIWLVPALPLAAALLTALLGKHVLRGQSHWPTVLALAASTVISLALLVKVHDLTRDAKRGLAPTAENVTEIVRQILQQAREPHAEHITKSLWTWAAIDHAHPGKPMEEERG